MKHVLAPIEEPYALDVAALLEKYPRSDGYLLQLFRVFANSPRFLRKGPANLLDGASPLSLRHREIVILRVCANNNCEYEWGVHVAAFSAHAGLTRAQVEATRLGDHDATCWLDDDRVLICAVDQLCARARIEDETYMQFQKTWNVEQQLEIMALCGNYHTVSFVANSARLEPEAFAPRFPGEA